MKLILRKNDSATSLLLFIYNNYMAINGQDRIKLSALIEILQVFGKNETAIRMSLSRAAKAGLLMSRKIENDIFYALTDEGKKAIRYWNDGVRQFFKRYQLRNQPWDHQWYFISLDFGEEKKEIKPEIIDQLQQKGFAQITANTWISPYHLKDDIWELISSYGLNDSFIEIHGTMEIHRNMEEFLIETYGFEKLKAEYRKFLEQYEGRKSEILKMSAENEFVQNGLAFPVLHELGFRFFQIASEDAALPQHLIAEWEGDKAARLMLELRESLLEAIRQYLKKYNEKEND